MPIEKSLKILDHEDTTVLRAIAIILIVNSHLDRIYPISFVATGGAIGNSLFFALSSYGLFLSFIRKPLPFRDWYKRRILRIYPSIWCTLLVLGVPYEFIFKRYFPQLDYHLSMKAIVIFLINFIYPLELWFIPALFTFYFLGYFIIKCYSYEKLALIALGTILLYFYLYCFHTNLETWSVETQIIRYVFYFSIFVFGIFLASEIYKVRYSGVKDFYILFFLLTLFYMQKLCLNQGYMLKMQFFQQLIIFPIILFFLKINKSKLIDQALNRFIFIERSCKYLARNSLEIFIVHQYFVSSAFYLKVSFPLNLAYIIFGCLASIVVIKSIVNYLKNRFIRQMST